MGWFGVEVGYAVGRSAWSAFCCSSIVRAIYCEAMKTLSAFLMMALLAIVTRAAELPDPANDPVVLAVQKVLPSVVNISTERLVERRQRDPFDEMFQQFFGGGQRAPVEGGQSLGSGVIVDQDGWIVSNYHVVRRATKISVVLSDGTQYAARYVSGDEANDLALLKVEGKKPFPFVEIATDREPLLGETVIAVGNPFGLEHTVTKGIISAKKRRYAAGDVVFDDVLQTDAAINPGNSGGPLINTRGQLVGINMAILSQAEGIGFAIPAGRVANLLAVWLTPEKRARLWLGLRFVRAGEKLVVADVQVDSPSAKAGVAAQDEVLRVDGTKFADVLLLQRYFLHKKDGDVVTFEVERAGKTRRLEVKLAALPKLSVVDLMAKRFGLQVQPMTAELAKALGVNLTRGLLVSDVEKEGTGEKVGFARGMVITHLGGEEIDSQERLEELLAGVRTGDAVSVAVFVREQRGNIMFQRTVGAALKAR